MTGVLAFIALPRKEIAGHCAASGAAAVRLDRGGLAAVRSPGADPKMKGVET